ncbi:MAG: hypothetical protein Q8S55_21435, partial [Methylococcaceae bacterium]|nr:hypothetical protein [Methylococcaceae bacterium]
GLRQGAAVVGATPTSRRRRRSHKFSEQLHKINYLQAGNKIKNRLIQRLFLGNVMPPKGGLTLPSTNGTP